jgi:alanine-synthesizing transaminase
MLEYLKSHKLANVCYDIRGPVHARATAMEEEGNRIIKLNIGNPAPFGFDAPEEILIDVIHNIPNSEGYSESKGLYSARKAVMQYAQQLCIPGVEVNDIYLGNGVSELIVMVMQALANNGDEVLIPAPDYPLWTAATTLAGGKPVHYRCDEQSDWIPDIADIRARITDRTRAILVINPNNPTGAVYPREILEKIVEIAIEHRLVILSDEIYDKILYDDAQHTALGSISNEPLCITFNGLSKSYRLAGFRSGWMIISGAKHRARDFIEGVDILSSMRLCANVPAQHAIQTALGGYQSINDLVLPGGRLREQRDKRVGGDQRDSRRELRETAWRNLPVSASGPGGAPHPRRRKDDLRPADPGENAAGTGQCLQLPRAGPLPRGIPASRGRHRGSFRALCAIHQRLSAGVGS